MRIRSTCSGPRSLAAPHSAGGIESRPNPSSVGHVFPPPPVVDLMKVTPNLKLLSPAQVCCGQVAARATAGRSPCVGGLPYCCGRAARAWTVARLQLSRWSAPAPRSALTLLALSHGASTFATLNAHACVLL